MYNLLKFVHVASAAIWIGTVFTFLVLSSRLRRAGNAEAARAVVMEGKFFSTGVYMPAAIIMLITGIGLVQMGPWSFGMPWVGAGLALFIIIVIIGAGVVGRTARQLSAGAANPQVLVKRIHTFAFMNLILLLTTVFLMVVKP